MNLRFAFLSLAGSLLCSCVVDVSDLSSGLASLRSVSGGGGSSAGGAAGQAPLGGAAGESLAGQGGSAPAAAGTAASAGGDQSVGGGAGASCRLEICDGKDDDCNQVIDNGCPTGVLRGPTTHGSPLGDSPGGFAFDDLCGEDELVVGLALGLSDWLHQVGVVCQKYALQVDRSVTPYRYSIALSAGQHLAPHPSSSDATQQMLGCPAGSALVGLSVAQQHSSLGQPDDNIVITGVSGVCAVPAIDEGGTAHRLKWSTPSAIGLVSGSAFAKDLAVTAEDSVTADHFVVGLRGAAGAWVDQIGMTSSTIEVLQL